MDSRRELPHRQLRNIVAMGDDKLICELPHRQLRKNLIATQAVPDKRSGRYVDIEDPIMEAQIITGAEVRRLEKAKKERAEKRRRNR